AVLVTTDPAALTEARAELVCTLRAFDLACSRFRDDSELTRVNRSPGRPVPVGELLWNAVVAALAAAEKTAGLVDPTVGRTLRLTGYDRPFVLVERRDGRLVDVAGEPAGRFAEVELDENARTVRVPHGVELDLGATAKALAADCIASAAADRTTGGVLVSLGGDIAVSGEPPPGGWPVRIAADHRQSLVTAGPTVGLAAGGLATSTTRVRRWRTASGERHHIVDPRTGRPAAGPWRTATVAAPTCLEANTASTASIVLGDRALEWLDARRLPARLVDEHDEAFHTGAWPVGLVSAA
ncbi:MAG TPA: FAD:protein FMN transferase, partial [Acidimicrobiales bacterium]|nr:FAD:protein FMN transferase [Acidimicrobiales bacterium]